MSGKLNKPKHAKLIFLNCNNMCRKRSMLDPSSRATKVEFSELESDSDVDSDFEEGGRSVASIQSRIKV